MWNIICVSEDFYEFQQELSYTGETGATVFLKSWEDRLEVHADIFLHYIYDIETYEQLLTAIRHFSNQKKQERARYDCLIRFHCRGLLDPMREFALPGARIFAENDLMDSNTR